MLKTELIASLANKHPHLSHKDIELAVNAILQIMTDSIATGEHIEIRGFGSFSTFRRDARIGRNPKTGETVCLTSRYAANFKPGLEMRDRVNASRHDHPIIRDL